MSAVLISDSTISTDEVFTLQPNENSEPRALPDEPEIASNLDLSAIGMSPMDVDLDFSKLDFNPQAATHHLPGTEGKIMVLSARYALGMDLWNPGDLLETDNYDTSEDPLDEELLVDCPMDLSFSRSKPEHLNDNSEKETKTSRIAKKVKSKPRKTQPIRQTPSDSPANSVSSAPEPQKPETPDKYQQIEKEITPIAMDPTLVTQMVLEAMDSLEALDRPDRKSFFDYPAEVQAELETLRYMEKLQLAMLQANKLKG